MTLTDLVAPNAILPALKVNNKKQAIQELAARAAELCGQNERVILEILLQREKLGSTAVGNGVAIPHGKLAKLGRLFGLFARLQRGIDFEALDGQPVDLVFLLLAPEAAGADHLKALARVAPTRSMQRWRCRRRAARRKYPKRQAQTPLIPAQAGIQAICIQHWLSFWVPACAGTSGWIAFAPIASSARSPPRAPGSRRWQSRLRACPSA
jgi:PTS system nitrogen regulatory IIA component